MLGIRVGVVMTSSILGLWVVGIKEVMHPLEDTEIREKGAVHRGRAHFVQV